VVISNIQRRSQQQNTEIRVTKHYFPRTDVLKFPLHVLIILRAVKLILEHPLTSMKPFLPLLYGESTVRAILFRQYDKTEKGAMNEK